ncbi:MAG: outer membrane beta-barrel protein [Gammaproteobacteria bacterium]|jgi:OOP family OmpA-OmpF porin|nr:outer membrane beta-barrel protein [Gammaproteobacteria bacterium]
MPILTLLALAAGTAQAQQTDHGLYIGAGGGHIEQSDAVFLADTCNLLQLGCTSDGTSTGFKVFAGYQGGPGFGLEAAYVKLGEASITVPDIGTISTDTQGLTVSLIPSIPVAGGVSLFARGGVFAWYADATGTGTAFPGGETSEGAGYSFVYGGGAALRLGQNAKVRVEWERMNIDEKVDIDGFSYDLNTDIDLYSASIVLQFH